MKKLFKGKVEGNWFKKLLMKWNNWHMDKLFTCPLCHKGELVNRKGYFECTVCKHEFRGDNNGQNN